MPQPGDQVTPSIRLVRELGSGGMGSVWVADHAALQTEVVVKFIHAELAGDKEVLLRFSREAAAGANVKSPHVVQVLDHGIAPDGAPFIVMELLEGSDLAAHCEKNGPMSLLEVDHVISQTCKALTRAHERGIVHRDIKPQNIFLTNVGGGELFVKVLDFGIAKASWSQGGTSSATKTGAQIGTPQYMSPEQTLGEKSVDYRTDIWALGAVAFECVTGQRPFDAETIGGIAVAICSGPMPVPSRVNRTLSADVDRWFARACARDMTQRFDSAKEMADAFHLIVTGRPADQRLSKPQRDVSVAPAAPAPQMMAVPVEAERSPGPGITNRGAMSGEAQNGKFPQKGRGRGAVAATVALLLLAGGAAMGLKLTNRLRSGPSAGSGQGAEPRPQTALQETTVAVPLLPSPMSGVEVASATPTQAPIQTPPVAVSTDHPPQPRVPPIPPAGAGVSAGAVEVDGRRRCFSVSQVQSVIGMHQLAIRRACWERDPTTKPTVNVSVSMTIGPDGTPQGVSASGDEGSVAKCIENDVRGWHFPAMGCSQITEFSFKFVRDSNASAAAADLDDKAPAQCFSSGQVQQVIGQHQLAIRRSCWERDPTTLPTVNVSVSLIIGPDGSSQNVAATGDEPSVADCIANDVRGWHFPALGCSQKTGFSFKFVRQ